MIDWRNPPPLMLAAAFAAWVFGPRWVQRAVEGGAILLALSKRSAPTAGSNGARLLPATAASVIAPSPSNGTRADACGGGMHVG